MIGTVGVRVHHVYALRHVDAERLVENLGSKEAAIVAVEAFTRAFLLSMPTGKQNTFANRTRPGVALLEVREDQPVNLSSAFEKPVDVAGGALPEAAKLLVEMRLREDAELGTAPVKSAIPVLMLAAQSEVAPILERAQRARSMSSSPSPRRPCRATVGARCDADPSCLTSPGRPAIRGAVTVDWHRETRMPTKSGVDRIESLRRRGGGARRALKTSAAYGLGFGRSRRELWYRKSRPRSIGARVSSKPRPIAHYVSELSTLWGLEGNAVLPLRGSPKAIRSPDDVLSIRAALLPTRGKNPCLVFSEQPLRRSTAWKKPGAPQTGYRSKQAAHRAPARSRDALPASLELTRRSRDIPTALTRGIEGGNHPVSVENPQAMHAALESACPTGVNPGRTLWRLDSEGDEQSCLHPSAEHPFASRPPARAAGWGTP
ncbi:hypothetical protein FQR65_LT20668 [Abscondita terminalis]|nr:hypothetical protein FQR65_LT20668 [Abscondita terminalis]